MKTLKIGVNKITEFIVILKKIGKCNCMLFFCVGYISGNYLRSSLLLNVKFWIYGKVLYLYIVIEVIKIKFKLTNFIVTSVLIKFSKQR